MVGRGTGDGGLSGVVSEESLSMFWDREYATHVTARAVQIMQSEFQETTWRACWEQTVNDRPAADVAAELGISSGACYIAKSRVLARLRDVLGDMLVARTFGEHALFEPPGSSRRNVLEHRVSSIPSGDLERTAAKLRNALIRRPENP